MTEGDPRSARRYITDENVTRSAARALRGAGRECLESRDVIGPQAADKVLEWVAASAGFILVSRDRDFRGILEGVNSRGFRKAAKSVWLRVLESREATRLAQCIDMIEEILDHADEQGLDIEYIQVLEDEINVKYRVPRLRTVTSADRAVDP